MKGKLLALMLLAGSSVFAAPRVVVGFNFGYAPRPVPYYYAPPVAPVVRYIPPSPGFGYTWVSGYYYPVARGWGWRPGYWVRPPYRGARWIGPRYYGGRYYGGYWRR